MLAAIITLLVLIVAVQALFFFLSRANIKKAASKLAAAQTESLVEAPAKLVTLSNIDAGTDPDDLEPGPFPTAPSFSPPTAVEPERKPSVVISKVLKTEKSSSVADERPLPTKKSKAKATKQGVSNTIKPPKLDSTPSIKPPKKMKKAAKK